MDPSMDAFAEFVKDVGFPIAVATFVLIRMNGTVGALKEAVKELTVLMRQHLEQNRQ